MTVPTYSQDEVWAIVQRHQRESERDLRFGIVLFAAIGVVVGFAAANVIHILLSMGVI